MSEYILNPKKVHYTREVTNSSLLSNGPAVASWHYIYNQHSAACLSCCLSGLIKMGSIGGNYNQDVKPDSAESLETANSDQTKFENKQNEKSMFTHLKPHPEDSASILSSIFFM